MLLFVVTGFWLYWTVLVTVAIVMLLKEGFNFHILLCGNNALI
jgi:hypothetical protein